jgi:hypothetical protein
MMKKVGQIACMATRLINMKQPGNLIGKENLGKITIGERIILKGFLYK